MVKCCCVFEPRFILCIAFNTGFVVFWHLVKTIYFSPTKSQQNLNKILKNSPRTNQIFSNTKTNKGKKHILHLNRGDWNKKRQEIIFHKEKKTSNQKEQKGEKINKISS